MIKKCHYCGEPIEKGATCFQVMLYTREGKQSFVKMCSKVCAKTAKNINANMHQQIADDVRNCSIQKMKTE